MKTCNGCGDAKPLVEFSIHESKGRIGKPRARCKNCESKASSERRQRVPQKCLDSERRWRAAHPDKVREYARNYGRKHADEVLMRAMAWAANHPAEVKAYQAEYRKRAHVKAKHAEDMNRRNAVISASPVPQSYIDAVFVAFNGCCAYCKTAKATTLDHVQPLAADGKHEVGNLLPACVSCNSSKRNRPPNVWCDGRGINLDQLLNAVSGLRGMA